jgi:hypothetical protein
MAMPNSHQHKSVTATRLLHIRVAVRRRANRLCERVPRAFPIISKLSGTVVLTVSVIIILVSATGHVSAQTVSSTNEGRALVMAKEWLSAFQNGHIKRFELEPSVDRELTDEMVHRESIVLRQYGQPVTFTFLGSNPVQQATGYTFGITCTNGKIIESIALDRHGKIAGIDFQTFPASP